MITFFALLAQKKQGFFRFLTSKVVSVLGLYNTDFNVH